MSISTITGRSTAATLMDEVGRAGSTVVEVSGSHAIYEFAAVAALIERAAHAIR